jgi:hypothetical protein
MDKIYTAAEPQDMDIPDPDGSDLRGLAARIFQCLVRAGAPRTSRQVADELGANHGAVAKALMRMWDHAYVEYNDDTGAYYQYGGTYHRSRGIL